MSYQLIHGSAHSLPQIPDKSVHLVVCSPPYFSLRRYEGEQEIDWSEMSYSPMAGLPAITIPAQRAALGLEKDISAYIGHLILCLREWGRILRDDGLCFVNLGDSYVGSANSGGDESRTTHSAPYRIDALPAKKINGLKPKNLLMAPSRFALAAQAEGWTLRSRPPWLKRNSMPESVGDRPSTSHEEWFMLAKGENYFWDIEAIKIPHSTSNGWFKQRENGKGAATRIHGNNHDDSQTLRNDAGRVLTNDYSGRNRRTGDWYFESLDIAISETETWLNHAKQTRKHGGLLLGVDGDPAAFLVNPHPYKSAHFATFPQKMIEPIIRAGTSQHGVCAACGSPYKRVVERTGIVDVGRSTDAKRYSNGDRNDNQRRLGQQYQNELSKNPPTTTGWQPTCNCQCDEVVPAVVLDPFCGSGTTLRAAMKLGRSAIGVDISDQYLGDLVPERTSNVQMELAL